MNYFREAIPPSDSSREKEHLKYRLYNLQLVGKYSLWYQRLYMRDFHTTDSSRMARRWELYVVFYHSFPRRGNIIVFDYKSTWEVSQPRVRKNAPTQESALKSMISRALVLAGTVVSRAIHGTLPKGKEKDRNRAEKTHFYHFCLVRFQCLKGRTL